MTSCLVLDVLLNSGLPMSTAHGISKPDKPTQIGILETVLEEITTSTCQVCQWLERDFGRGRHDVPGNLIASG